MKRGYFGLAIYHPKKEVNWGSLVRTAKILNCSFIAAIGARFPLQASDTRKSHRHLPVFEFQTFEEFQKFMPMDCKLVGVELDERATNLKNFVHPERAVYLMGAENTGLPQPIMDKCYQIVKLEGEHSMNVACAGSIVLYHRQAL
jgi:tRNA G18 (ribose-2'-O)-methylase SpoU